MGSVKAALCCHYGCICCSLHNTQMQQQIRAVILLPIIKVPSSMHSLHLLTFISSLSVKLTEPSVHCSHTPTPLWAPLRVAVGTLLD